MPDNGATALIDLVALPDGPDPATVRHLPWCDPAHCELTAEDVFHRSTPLVLVTADDDRLSVWLECRYEVIRDSMGDPELIVNMAVGNPLLDGSTEAYVDADRIGGIAEHLAGLHVAVSGGGAS